MSTFDSQVSKREIILTQIEHTRYTISPKEFKAWVTRISFALLLCTTELSAVKYFAICSWILLLSELFMLCS